MSKRKDKRKMEHLMRKHNAISLHLFMKSQGTTLYDTIKWRLQIFEEHEYGNVKNMTKTIHEQLQIYSIGKKFGMTIDEIEDRWHTLYRKQQNIRDSYKVKPKKPYQDNKTYINTRSRDELRTATNKIRYPKKKRKTAWKRFYRLFPHLKEEKE